MRGGRRAGAGRKPGAASRLSVAAREAAQATGELPHEFLLRVARGEDTFTDLVNRASARTVRRKPTLAERVDAAKAAAPYFAPRLATTEFHHQGAVGWMDLGALVTPEQQETIAREMLRRAGYEVDD